MDASADGKYTEDDVNVKYFSTTPSVEKMVEDHTASHEIHSSVISQVQPELKFMDEIVEPQTEQAQTGDTTTQIVMHQADLSFPPLDFLFEIPDSLEKTHFDHLMSQLFNISQSVYMNIKNYAHRACLIISKVIY